MRSAVILLLSALFPLPVLCQSLMEFGDLRAGAAGTGAGAGLSAGMGHQGAVKKSFGKITKIMTPAQQAAFAAQTKAVNKYWASGCQYEMAKQWSNAEKTFAYVLQVVTMRDGSKSPTRMPILQKLVTATKAQKKLDTAINYQKSIVELQKSVPRPDERMVAKTQQELTGLYLDKHDYKSAEPVLRDSVSLYAKYPSLPVQQKIVTLKTYSVVLRKLKKNAEADKIDKQLNPEMAKGKTAVDVPIAPKTDTEQTTKTAEPSLMETNVSQPPTALPVSSELKTIESSTTEIKTTEPATPESESSDSKTPDVSAPAAPALESAVEANTAAGAQVPAQPNGGESSPASDADKPAAK